VIHRADCRVLVAELFELHQALRTLQCGHGQSARIRRRRMPEIVTADRLRGRKLCRVCAPALTTTDKQIGLSRGPVTHGWRTADV
jgi:hypothetical protein